jgi:hypothetical protein
LSGGVFARPVPHPLDEVRGLLFSVSGSGGLQVRERLFVQPCVDGSSHGRRRTLRSVSGWCAPPLVVEAAALTVG